VSFGPIDRFVQAGFERFRVQVQFGFWDHEGGFDHSDARFDLFDGHGFARVLFADADLAARADGFGFDHAHERMILKIHLECFQSTTMPP
jgi:hypothetical protein